MKILFLSLLISFIIFDKTLLSQSNCDQAGIFLTDMPECITGYSLEFEDNFDGSSLDVSKWSIHEGVGRDFQFKDAKQWLSPNNIEVSNGTLKLIAKQEQTTGTFVTDWSANPPTTQTETFEYTSAEISTKEQFFHGKYEISCRMPNGKGFWPAFWMFGANNRWNEIDVFDNLKGNNRFSCGSRYNYDGIGDAEECRFGTNDIPDFSEWHTFTCIFDFDKITWLIDDNPIRVHNRFYTTDGNPIFCGDEIANGSYMLLKAFPVEEMNIFLTLVIRSGEAAPDNNTVFPSALEIDYIRYYKRVQLPTCDATADLLVTAGGTVPPTLNYLPNTTVSAKNSIVTIGSVSPLPGQTWRAGEFIELNPGFETEDNTTVVFETGDCIELFGRLANPDSSDDKKTDTLEQKELSPDLYSGVQKNNMKEQDSASEEQPYDNSLKSNQKSENQNLQSTISNPKSAIIISPNPSDNGKFNLTSTLQEVGCMDAEITVMNALGQTIHNEPLNHYNFPVSIDLSSQPKGTYFVKIANGKKNFVLRAVSK